MQRLPARASRLWPAACGLAPAALARRAVDDARHRSDWPPGIWIDRINAGPVYTLAALKTAREVRPDRLLLVGGRRTASGNGWVRP